MGCEDYAVNTYSFIQRCPVEECIPSLCDVGFRTFELMMYPGHLWPADYDSHSRSRFRQLLRDNDSVICSLNQPQVDINLAGATDEMLEYSLSTVLKMIELASDLEVPRIVIGGGKLNHLLGVPLKEATGRLFRALDILVPAARVAGSSLLIENMPISFLSTGSGIMTAIADYGSAEIGVTFDVANAFFVDDKVAPALAAIGSRLKLVHVSDTTRELFRHDPIGMGSIDFEQVGRELRDANWTEPPVLEVISLSEDPVIEIRESAIKLDAMGWS